MKRFAFSKAVIATALIGACSSAFAADTAEIIVKGQVVPAACSIDITGGGVFDYGIMTKAQIEVLNGVDAQTSQTPLDEKTATFTIDCGQSDTRVAFRILDALANTATPDLTGFTVGGLPMTGTRKHGLGTVDVSGVATNIGQYGAVIPNTSLKLNIGSQTNVQGEATVTNGGGWRTDAGAPAIHGSDYLLHSFREQGAIGSEPQPFARASGDLHVRAAVNRLDALPDAFSFNGRTTLTLVYLGADNKPLP